MPGHKNQHFVPQSYLRRFHSVSDKQVGFFNLTSGKLKEVAAIRDQCSRDYFYSKNPLFEKEFGNLESAQKAFFDRMINEHWLPDGGSQDHHTLLSLIMFQAGRTVTTMDRQNHLANQFGKAMMRKSFEKDGKTDLLEYLDKVTLTVRDGTLDSVLEHILMSPLIEDLNVTLLVNKTKEDFVTSDHPIALCNSLPASSPARANLGFASRGLIILFPIAPNILLFLNDPEVYKVDRSEGRVVYLERTHDVVELNILQCVGATSNLYFANASHIEQTLRAFRKRQQELRAPLPTVVQRPTVMPDGRRAILVEMPPVSRRVALPKAVQLRRAVRSRKYKVGNDIVRDPHRAAMVSWMLDEVKKRRDAAASS